jgi:ABC-type transport system involved in multi-copper enzyme maturation permease subunit
MTSTLTSPTASPPRPDTAAGRPPLARLTLVELRKLVDTRAGAWLLAFIALANVGIVVVQLIQLDDAQLTYAEFFFPAMLPVGILLPVLGILSVTSEWSQRTAMSTLTLVPSRGRVVAAKLAAAAVAAVAAVLFGLVFAAAANLVGAAMGGSGAWDVSAAGLANALLFQLLNVLMGVGFGLLLLNSPLAIVLYFLLPTLWGILGGMIAALRSAAEWLDLGTTMGPMLADVSLTGGQWARLAVSSAVWIAFPLLAGLVRVSRAEIK